MFRRSAKITVVALLLIAAIASTRYYYGGPPVPEIPVYKPVEKYVLQKVETDTQKTFVKTSTEDAGLGYTKHVFTNTRAEDTKENTLLIISSIADVSSFGQGRSFKDFIDVIGSFRYDKSLINLAFFCGTDELFEHVDLFFENFFAAGTQYGKVTVLGAKFLQSPFASSDHTHRIQRQRRRIIARARNFALFNSLDTEQHTVFLDADIISIDHPDMLLHFVKSERDIIVPRVERGGNKDYDKNSWRGSRRKPTPNQLALMDKKEWGRAAFVPKDMKNAMYHLADHLEVVKTVQPEDPARQLDYLVELDSVGGAVLFAKSVIYKQGAVFPPLYVVGTTWDREEGYDGIETEGLCYVAKTMGYTCWGMPNLVAQHDDSG